MTDAYPLHPFLRKEKYSSRASEEIIIMTDSRLEKKTRNRKRGLRRKRAISYSTRKFASRLTTRLCDNFSFLLSASFSPSDLLLFMSHLRVSSFLTNDPGEGLTRKEILAWFLQSYSLLSTDWRRLEFGKCDDVKAWNCHSKNRFLDCQERIIITTTSSFKMWSTVDSSVILHSSQTNLLLILQRLVCT